MSLPAHAAAANTNSKKLHTGNLLPNSHAQAMQHQRAEMEQQRARQRHNIHVLFLEARKDDHILNRCFPPIPQLKEVEN